MTGAVPIPTAAERTKRFGERFFFHIHYSCSRIARLLGSNYGLDFSPLLFPVNPRSIDFDSRFRDHEFRFCKWTTTGQNRSVKDQFWSTTPHFPQRAQEMQRLYYCRYIGDIKKNTVTVREKI